MENRKKSPHKVCDTDEQLRAPLVEALFEYTMQQHASFHVPGHKNGHWYEQAALAASGHVKWNSLLYQMAELLTIDVTEGEETDDLHYPTGAIAEAQQLAARCFGAEETHFLVGGSTVGNIALIMSCCIQPDDIVIVQRNVHKSVLHGLMMASARAVFLSPRIDSASGLATAPSREVVEQSIQAYPEAKAVFVTNPNYYGMGIDLRQLTMITHQYGIPLLVDEAHGAHYGFHPGFPESALMAGADGVVQSTHKMLGGMTMSAMLHIQGEWIDRARMKKLLTLLQSSSPSYPLMASLDISRYFIARHGVQTFTDGLEAVRRVRSALTELPIFEVVDLRTSRAKTAYDTIDPFKVVIRCTEGHISGYKLLECLKQNGCVAEMADMRHVVLVLSLGSTLADAQRLIDALWTIAVTLNNAVSNTDKWLIPYSENTERLTSSVIAADGYRMYSEPVPFSIYEQRHVRMKRVPVHEAIGYKTAESVVPYPPGIPLLLPGEVITEAVAHKLMMLAHAGAKCHDVEDESLRTIRVFDTKGEKGIE